MKKRAIIYFMIILCLFYPFINSSSAFYSIQGSLAVDKLRSTNEIIIIEGIYFFVIDNTGLVSGNFQRNDSYVEYSIRFNASWNEDTVGQKMIHNGSYLMIPFSFEYEGVYVTEITIEINASSRVSSFVTTDSGLAQYHEELRELEPALMRPLIIAISVVGGILAIFIVFFSLGTKRITPVRRIFRRTRRHIVPVKCDNCGEKNPPGTTICEFCQARIKYTGEKIRTIG